MSPDDAVIPVRKPTALRPGDVIAIVAPTNLLGGAIPPGLEETFQRGLANLRQMNFRVQVAHDVGRSRSSPDIPADRRAADLNALFAADAVRAIVCLAGGWGANALLPLLDWELIARRPKIVIGYSAITALLVGLYARTGLVTFHGPMVLDGFSEFPTVLEYTRDGLERVVCRSEAAGQLRPPDSWTIDVPRDDRSRDMRRNPGWRWLRPGRAQGRLVGGNLHALLTLAGTTFWPRLSGAILFLEEVNLIPSAILEGIGESLVQPAMLDAFDQIAGLIVGKINDLSPSDRGTLDQIVLACTGGRNFPVLCDMDFGHTDPRLTLPIGVLASLDSARNCFSLDEGAVVDSS